MGEDILATGYKGDKKNGKNLPKLQNGLTTWNKNYEYLKVKIHIDSLKTTTAKVPNRKTPGIDGIPGFWF